MATEEYEEGTYVYFDYESGEYTYAFIPFDIGVLYLVVCYLCYFSDTLLL